MANFMIMNTALRWAIPALWFTLLVYWLYGAARAKRTVGRRGMYIGVLVRLGIVAFAFIAYRAQTVRRLQYAFPSSPNVAMLLVGTAICAAGVGLAIAARAYLGRNWGMPGSRKENPDLVTGGPYRLIRHPIYTGILLAMLGTGIAEGVVVWFALVLVAGAYFLYSARREERIMAEVFPDQYPAYVKRTKMLVPFIV
jgi:protein-S-isoprenylcysteine O-methyltransferase Ste14